MDASSCNLGQWINNCSSEKCLSLPEFKQLQAIHTELHDYTDKLLFSNENEKSAGIEHIKNLYNEVLKKLESLTTLMADK